MFIFLKCLIQAFPLIHDIMILKYPLKKRHENPIVSVGPRAEKFNIVGNDYRRTRKCDFFVLDWKYLFWATLVRKIKIVSLS